jgi:hypothetical protein
MGRYVGTQQLADYLGQTLPFTSTPAGTQQQLLSDCIVRAEAAIDAYTRRNFAGTAGTVYYNRYAQGLVRSNALYLREDLHTLVGVINGDTTTIPVGSVWTEPRNASPPYRVIRLKSSYVWVWNTDSDVIVSGTFGYGTVAPYDIQQATVRTAAYYFRSKDSGFVSPDVAGFDPAGNLPVAQGIPQDVRYLLAPYRSRTGGIV